MSLRMREKRLQNGKYQVFTRQSIKEKQSSGKFAHRFKNVIRKCRLQESEKGIRVHFCTNILCRAKPAAAESLTTCKVIAGIENKFSLKSFLRIFVVVLFFISKHFFIYRIERKSQENIFIFQIRIISRMLSFFPFFIQK